MSIEKHCCRCGFDICTCEYYAEWKVSPSLRRSVPEQLRLRRSAAWRCPRLACGRRDPISESVW